MYVTTFYSYKGGVGRTMALVNIAYLMARAGKRVLAVDFDLEAPGLSSYGPFRSAGNHPGLVEFVHAYLDSDVAPDVSDYILECRAGDLPIWLMPAGRHTQPEYARQYSSINWSELYRERDGFLLFEDLRQQWEQYDGQGFDYVLIDSRTGHTDIGGICTRQLPDAVVIQYLPTQQNVEGLLPIVKGIKAEGAPVRRSKVRLVFCPSNLPDGDDQELILKRALDYAQAHFGFKSPASEIYHYGALDLIEQPIYVASSPGSRLSAEYARLYRSIIEGNLTDRAGALIALTRMRDEYQAALTGAEKAPDEKGALQMQADANLIAATFPQDVEIAWQLSILAALMTRPVDELEALNVVVESASTDVARALLRRSRAHASLDNISAAIADLDRLLTSEESASYEIGPASALLQRLAPHNKWVETMERAAVNPRMAPPARSRVIEMLLTHRDFAQRAIELARQSAHLGRDSFEPEGPALVLALMADGQFEAAMRTIAPDRSRVLARNSMQDAFNYGLAEWALTGEAPADLLSYVLTVRKKLHYDTTDANGLQCFALCQYLVGRPAEALNDLRTAQLSARRGGPVFSCWRYLTVTSKEMLEDMDEMEDIFINGGELRPPTRDGLKGANAR